MPKSSQTSSKVKSSSKTEAKSKNMKPKSKKSVKPSSEPAPTPAPSQLISSTIPTPSSYVHDALTIPTSTGASLPKPTTHTSVSALKNTSKLTMINATPRKYVKSDKVVLDAASKVDTLVKKVVVQGESVSITISQVKLPPSKLDVLVSTIDVSPLDIVPPTSEKPQMEELTVEITIATLEKGVGATDVMPMVEGESSKEPVQKDAFYSLSFSWTEYEDDNEGEEEGGVVANHEEHQTQDMANEEKMSENEGDSSEEKESETEDKIDEQVDDSREEEKNSEEEGDSESEGEDQEKASEREGKDEESEEENANTSRNLKAL
ncbi:uncharacterized protein [Nicotiana tomentosiformis]|uniref:uncharacterized protein n=1 Tax=Nicotiana tomentosiformis TaxID=4098 RepID=UPI00051AC2E8